MFSLFNFSTLQVSLQKETKTLTVKIHRPERGNALGTEVLYELETLLNWCTEHIEINSLVITCSGEHFSTGLNDDDLEYLSHEKLFKIYQRLQKIVVAFFHLPQTVVFDLKKGADSLGLELSLGGDIRLAEEGAFFRFNHLKQGLIPSAGGLTLLSRLIGHSQAKHLVLGAKEAEGKKLEAFGFLHETYEKVDTLEHAKQIFRLLKEVSEQSPVARIQSKLAFLQEVLPYLKHLQKEESKVTNAALSVEDWKEYARGRRELRSPRFTPAQDMKQV